MALKPYELESLMAEDPTLVKRCAAAGGGWRGLPGVAWGARLGAGCASSVAPDRLRGPCVVLVA